MNNMNTSYYYLMYFSETIDKKVRGVIVRKKKNNKRGKTSVSKGGLINFQSIRDRLFVRSKKAKRDQIEKTNDCICA